MRISGHGDGSCVRASFPRPARFETIVVLQRMKLVDEADVPRDVAYLRPHIQNTKKMGPLGGSHLPLSCLSTVVSGTYRTLKRASLVSWPSSPLTILTY